MMKLDLNEFTNLMKYNDMYNMYTKSWFPSFRIDISKYEIDSIYNIYSKTDIFEKKEKFVYDSETKELTIINKTSNIITIEFSSISQERELKINQLGI
jgi:hypothetical protein